MRRAVPLVAVLLGACGNDATGHVCTAIYALITSVVVNQAGQPATGLTIADSVHRTGATFTVPQEPLLPGGTYIVFDDGRQSRIRETGDDVQVNGTLHGERVFSITYRFDVPDGCHVHKVSGPDSIPVETHLSGRTP